MKPNSTMQTAILKLKHSGPVQFKEVPHSTLILKKDAGKQWKSLFSMSEREVLAHTSLQVKASAGNRGHATKESALQDPLALLITESCRVDSGKGREVDAIVT